MQRGDLETMLGEMIDCGREFERRACWRASATRSPTWSTRCGRSHRGTHRPYPCGAGAGYLGVSADGELSACHRFVGDDEGAMGSLANGVDRDRQADWLAERHVHRQEPCRSCWARYLCGGGCHHEVIHRGRPACDYIRGWLHYCLEAYLRLSAAQPGMFRKMSTVSVIGGGPAGSTFAARMAQLGYHVVLLEREFFPRRRLGESLSPGVLPLLAMTGARCGRRSGRVPQGAHRARLLG